MHRFAILIISLVFLFTTMASPYPALSYEKKWGIDYTFFIESIDKTTQYITFKPAEKPDYSNRVARFISSLNIESKKDLEVIRLLTNPETDYLFFKGKLCSITENRGIIPVKEGEAILKSFTKKFGPPRTEKKSSLYIYTYKKGRTQVILYQQLIDNNIMRCKIYSYTNDIFNLLFSD